MHIHFDKLFAYTDGELSEVERKHVKHHLDGCESCHRQLDDIRNDQSALGNKLDLLMPDAANPPRAGVALARLQRHIDTSQGNLIKGEVMLGNLGLNRNWQRVLGGLLAISVLVVVFSFAPARAAASELLSLFRLEEIVILPIDVEQIDRLEAVAEELGHDFFPGDMEILDEPGEPQYAESAGEASQLAGFAVRAPGTYEAAHQFVVRDGMTAQFVPDLALMQILFEAAELSPDLIPPEIDGQPFTVTLSTSVMQLWEDNALMTLQMESPTVEFPDAVDEEALGIAMLQFLGYSPADAAALSASIDWTTTLLLPLPSDLVNFESVVVDGTDGFYLTGASPEGEFEDYAAVLWQKDGFVYLVAGGQSQTNLLEIANSLQ